MSVNGIWRVLGVILYIAVNIIRRHLKFLPLHVVRGGLLERTPELPHL